MFDIYNFYFCFLIFILGLAIGSFLNVCIYRLPLGRSIVTPPSHCMQCGTRLKWRELIPVVSFVLLRGRCRYCGAGFSPRYALVEMVTALLFVICFIFFGISVLLIKALVLTAFLLVIVFIDIDHQLILDKVLLWLAGSGIVINLWTGAAGAADMLFGGLLGGGLLLIVAVASKGGMGGGDIKLAAALGLWLGWEFTLLTLLLAFVFGGAGGVVLLLLKLKNRKDLIPFGPFLALGTWVSLLYGNMLLLWYSFCAK